MYNVKKLLCLLILISSLSFSQNDIEKIKEVLFNQEKAWNNGDIHGFMLGYWKSEKLEFISGDKTIYGWMNTFIKYKTNYPTIDEMGKLRFQIIDVKLTSDTTATLNGKWELIRMNNHPQGAFLLTFQKFNENWLIVKDYTTTNE